MSEYNTIKVSSQKLYDRLNKVGLYGLSGLISEAFRPYGIKVRLTGCPEQDETIFITAFKKGATP